MDDTRPIELADPMDFSSGPGGSGDAPPHSPPDLVRDVVRKMMGPLDVVLGFSDLLQEAEDREQRDQFLGHVQNAARQLRRELARLEKLTRPRLRSYEQLDLFDRQRS